MAISTKSVLFVLCATLAFANAKEEFSASQHMEEPKPPIRLLQKVLSAWDLAYLQLGPVSRPPTQACQAACPDILSAYKDVAAKVDAVRGTHQHPDFAGLGTVIQGYCMHKRAFSCVLASIASAAACSQPDLRAMAAQVECFCSACPCAGHAYVSLFGKWGQSLSGHGQETSLHSWTEVCSIVEPLDCMLNSTACAAVFPSIASPEVGPNFHSAVTETKPQCISMNKPTSPEDCYSDPETWYDTPTQSSHAEHGKGAAIDMACGYMKSAFLATGWLLLLLLA